MNTYNFIIKETLERKVSMLSEDEYEAFLSASQAYRDQDIILTPNNSRISTEIISESDVLQTYDEYCKNFIKKELYEREGCTYYTCDLGIYLTEWINRDRSATYSSYKAKEYIKYWWDDAGDVLQYYYGNTRVCVNPFDEPEKFHVLMITEGVDALLSQCEIINKNWNGKITLTEENINMIIDEIEDLDIVF